MARFSAQVAYKGKSHYIGSFATKEERSRAVREWRESLPPEMCPCGVVFTIPFRAKWAASMFCPEHARWSEWMRYRYSLDNDAISALLAIKEDGCFVCGSIKRLCVDHCHSTGKVRGWLCFNCNTALGLVEDNIDRLAGLISYLNDCGVTNASTSTTGL